MNNDTIIIDNKIKYIISLENDLDKLEELFKKQYQEIYIPQSEIFFESLSRANDNFNLDCAEFDDNIVRVYKFISNIYDNFIESCEAYDDEYGVDAKNKIYQNEKDETIKTILSSFNSVKHDLTHQLNNLDKDLEQKVKEFTDELTQKEKEKNYKINEILRKLNIDIQRNDIENLRSCDDIEVKLLKTNDKNEIKKLKNSQKKIRLQGIEEIANIKRASRVELKDIENEFIEFKNRILISIKKYEFEKRSIKVELQTKLDIILLQIDKLNDFYLKNNYEDFIKYLKNSVLEINTMVSQANDRRYIYEKDILDIRLKQINFIKSSFMQLVKEFVNNTISQIDTYNSFFKDSISQYLLIKENILKENKDIACDNIYDMISFLKKMVDYHHNQNSSFVKSLVILKENKIKYVEYSLESYKNDLMNFVESSKINGYKAISELEQVLLKKIKREKLISKLANCLQNLYDFESTLFESMKFLLNNIINRANDFISKKVDNAIYTINNDGLKMDKQYVNKTLNDLLIPNKYIETYNLKINDLEEELRTINKTLSQIGKSDELLLLTLKKDLFTDYNNYQIQRDKLLKNDKKEIENNFKKEMKSIEFNRVNTISKL